jgi:hypothetical protein
MPCVLLIKKLDNTNVPDDGGRWRRGEIVNVYESLTPNLGGGQLDTAVFVRFELTDQSASAMQQYLDRYNRDIEYTLLNAGPPRRYEVNNKNANSNGIGFWTTDATLAIKTEWEIEHPLADITTIGYPNTGVNGLGNIWDMSGIFQPGEGAQFQAAVIEQGIATLDQRKIWYISPAMMTAIENNGGVLSGTTAQLGPNLKDKRLD